MACCYELSDFERDIGGCQFQSLPDEVIAKLGDLNREYELDGKTWCVFHLPFEADDGTKSEKADGTKEWVIDHFNAAIHALVDLARERKETCDLSGVIYPGLINFSGKKFPRVLFLDAFFSGDTWFNEANFERQVGFDSSRFARAAWFRNAVFPGLISFNGAEFSWGADFDSAVFISHATFLESCFRDVVAFSNVTFAGPVFFDRAMFEGEADFSSHGNFNDTEWAQQNYFDELSFEDAIFEGQAKFTNRHFLRPPDFRGCKFAEAPDFDGCSIHEGTKFPDRAAFKGRSGDDAALAYSILKRAMARFKRVDDEAMFHALELESKLNGEKSPQSAKLAISFYKWTTDYGQNFVWPWYWLFGIAVAAAFIFFLFDYFLADGVGCLDSAMFAASLAFEQVFRPFAIWGAGAPAEIVDYPWFWQILLKLVASIQSAASLGLIALSLFALRWRFKRP